MSPEPITIMAVHAHPDDEVVFTGGTLLLYHRLGVRTVVVTATGGEEGEIRDPDLDPDEARPRLREIRAEELRRGAEVLEIDHLESLGYRDSGMAGTEANANPDNFHNADFEQATRKLVALVRRYRPQIMITYDEFGSYGHPDHIQANKLTHAAFDRAGDPTYGPDLGEPWQPLKLYYTNWNEEGFEKAKEMFKERGLKWPWEEEEQQADPDPEHQSTEEAIVEHEQEVQEEKKPEYVPPPHHDAHRRHLHHRREDGVGAPAPYPVRPRRSVHDDARGHRPCDVRPGALQPREVARGRPRRGDRHALPAAMKRQ